MKASKFSDAQKAFILRQGKEGVPVAEICRKAGISQATYFNWKQKYEGLLPTEMRRLRQVLDENTQQEKIGGGPSPPKRKQKNQNPRQTFNLDRNTQQRRPSAARWQAP